LPEEGKRQLTNHSENNNQGVEVSTATLLAGHAVVPIDRDRSHNQPGEASMANVNLDKMSLKELLELESRIGKAISTAREREKADAKQKLAALAGELGFSVPELFTAGRGGSRGAGKSGVKYRNPKNHAQTWTGRGRKPNWLNDELENGADLEDFAI
jgi:DNA-binding protein H-NS